MFDFKGIFSSFFFGDKRDEELQEETRMLLPPKTTIIDVENHSPVKEEDIPHDIAETLQKAKRAREIAFRLSKAGYPVFAHTRDDLQYTIVEYRGVSQKNGKHVYEVSWTPVILSLHQYQKGHFNFKNEQPLIVFCVNGAWYLKLSWPNGFFFSTTKIDSIPI